MQSANLNSSSTRPHTCQHHTEITQSHTCAALIRLSTTTHKLLTFNTSQISSDNSEKLSLLTDTHLWTFLLHVLFKFPDVESLGRQTSVDRGRDPFNQFFSKLFRLDRTDPLNFGPKFPGMLVEWIAPPDFTPVHIYLEL